MFATRTLARAPVAGRLAGSVSTLRVASLSAFTSGSKLAGFFGRASGQSGAPAFQQLGLRMSLCRAFSSQPPTKQLSSADIQSEGLLHSYPFEQFKLEFAPFLKSLEQDLTPTLLAGNSHLTTNVLRAIFLQMMAFGSQLIDTFLIATRDYRLQLLKEQGLEAYFDEVKALMMVRQSSDGFALNRVIQELGITRIRLDTSIQHNFKGRQDFDQFMMPLYQEFPSLTDLKAPDITVKLPPVEDTCKTLLKWLKEYEQVKLTLEETNWCLRVWVADRYFDDYGHELTLFDTLLNSENPACKAYLLEFMRIQTQA